MKYTLTLIFLICLSGIVHAQFPSVNGISTNPSNPINNQLPSKKNTFFNWQDSLWSMQPAANCFRTNANESPFFKIDNLEELRQAKDMKWDDGWELIRRFTGMTETNAYTGSNPEHTYVILYNKYTGILRILLMVCRGQDFDAAQITLSFHATSFMKTDLLELSRPQVVALDKVFTTTSFSSVSAYSNENNKWFYADFPMMYDPCTSNYQSKLHIISKLVATGTINIQGSITGDIHTKEVSGRAVVQKPGTYSWQDFNNSVSGKATAVNGSIDLFKNETQKLAENLGTTDTAGKKDALAQFASTLKNSQFFISRPKCGSNIPRDSYPRRYDAIL